MKRRVLEKMFLDELAKTANISIACERVGLSRQTVYRWMNGDKILNAKVHDAIYLGQESISDLSESKVITGIKNGDTGLAKYWLNNHREEYMRPRADDFWKRFLIKTNKEDYENKVEIKYVDRSEKIPQDPELIEYDEYGNIVKVPISLIDSPEIQELISERRRNNPK